MNGAYRKIKINVIRKNNNREKIKSEQYKKKHLILKSKHTLVLLILSNMDDLI